MASCGSVRGLCHLFLKAHSRKVLSAGGQRKMGYIRTMVEHKYMITGLKSLRAVGVGLLLVALSACSTLGIPSGGSDEADSAQVQELDGELLFNLLAGEFAGNAGDIDKSVKYYQQAAKNSEDSRIAARATYIALYGKQYNQAMENLRRWEKLSPGDPDVNRMYAITYIKLHQPEKAAVHIQQIFDESDGSDKDKALAVKNLLQKEAETEDGLIVLDVLNRERPGNLHMLILQARYAAQLEQYDNAVALLDQVIEIDPSLDDVHVIKARILEAQGKRAASKALMLTVIENNPDNINLRMQYSRMLVEDREFDAAREQFLIMREQESDSPEVLMSLALLYIETQQLDEASTYLDELIQMGKKVDVANYYHGRIAQSRDQHKQAIAYYLKVKNGSYVFEAKLRIAILFARLDRPDEAIEQLEVLAEKTSAWPDKVRAYLAQGEILRGLRRHEEAFDMYTRALKQNPDDPDLLYSRALTAEKVDRLDITESDLLKVLTAEPENVNALNALGYTLADRTERLQEALEYIERAASLIPDDPAILDSLGWVSYRLGRMQDALKWLGMAFERLEDAEIAAHYGEVLWKSNQKEKARDVWNRGKEIDADHPVLVETLKRLLP
jgi:tetratricopeptide (TPR) repeat protein